jgi:hypothetical protein
MRLHCLVLIKHRDNFNFLFVFTNHSVFRNTCIIYLFDPVSLLKLVWSEFGSRKVCCNCFPHIVQKHCMQWVVGVLSAGSKVDGRMKLTIHWFSSTVEGPGKLALSVTVLRSLPGSTCFIKIILNSNMLEGQSMKVKLKNIVSCMNGMRPT